MQIGLVQLQVQCAIIEQNQLVVVEGHSLNTRNSFHFLHSKYLNKYFVEVYIAKTVYSHHNQGSEPLIHCPKILGTYFL